MALVMTMPSFSSATFTDRTTNTVSTVTGAADWVPPAVMINPLGTSVSGTVTVTGTATDSGSATKDIVVEARRDTGAWVELCRVADASSFSCTWNTAVSPFGPGSYTIRVNATDNAANTTKSPAPTTSTQVVDATSDGTVILDNPGAIHTGSVALKARINDVTWGWTGLRIEYRAVGSIEWSDVPNCRTSGRELTCSWPASDGVYEIRAAGTWLVLFNVYSETHRITVDRVRPNVTLAHSAASKTLTASPSDATSDVSRVVFQGRRNGTGSSWTDLTARTSGPWTYSYGNADLANGAWDFRAVAYDTAGHFKASDAVTNVSVSGRAAAKQAPSAPEKAPVERTPHEEPVGQPTEAPVDDEPTDTPDAPEEPGATAPVDTHEVTIATVTVEHRDEDTTLGEGDTVAITYTGELDLAAVQADWSGEAISVTARIFDGTLVGLASEEDVLEVLLDATSVQLGVVRLGSDQVSSEEALVFSSTMQAATTTVDGVARTTITLTVGPEEEVR